MLKNIFNKFINISAARYLVTFFMIGLFIVVLPIAMFLDTYFPRINFPYLATATIFFVLPLYFAIKLYIDGRKKVVIDDIKKMEQVVEISGDYKRDVFMGIFTFFFISFLNHVLGEFSSLNPFNERYHLSFETFIPGIFVSLFFFKNAHMKYKVSKLNSSNSTPSQYQQ